MRTDYSTSSLVIGNILFRDSGTAYNAQTQRHRLRLYGREYYTRRLTGVDKGEIVTITEPNDPGKSTLMKTVFGLVELRSGRIQFDGSDISRFSLLIVEQNAKKSLAVSHRGYVLEMGKKRFEGEGHSLLTNKEVRALYLGG